MSDLHNLRIVQGSDRKYVVSYEDDEGATQSSEGFADVKDAESYVDQLRAKQTD